MAQGVGLQFKLQYCKKKKKMHLTHKGKQTWKKITK
jgi:hypothetical protein